MRVQNVRAWFDRDLVKSNKEVTHAETGMKIKFDHVGRRKISRLPDDMLMAVRMVPEILEKGRYAGPAPETKGRPHILRWHYFVGTVRVAGKPITLRLAVREMATGRFLYDMNRQVDRGGG